MRGRKPTPTHLKLITGNPGKRAINTSEAAPRKKMPKCPDHLGGAAKAEWKSMAKKLSKYGLLSEIDGAALAGYCDAYGRWAEASLQLLKFGMIMKGSKSPLIQSPYLVIVNRALDQMKAFLVEFGMTPSSRSRITVPGEKERSLADVAKERANAVRSKQG